MKDPEKEAPDALRVTAIMIKRENGRARETEFLAEEHWPFRRVQHGA